MKIKKKDWEDYYKLAKKYYEEHGNLLIPTSYVTDNVNLGIWINSQRQTYNQGKLSKERISLLEEIGIVWSIRDENWEKMYALAKKYYEEHGNLLVPVSYVTKEGIKLGNWISNQRALYKNGLYEERRILLEEIGIVWNIHDENWEKMYALAKKYYIEKGNLLVPISYVTEDGIKLGNWISNQRRLYSQNQMPKKRRILLENIGIVWNVYEEDWQRMYELATKYKEKHGNLLIPTSYVTENGVKLGCWLMDQRTAYRRYALSEERISLLEKIGIAWRIHVKNWENMYELAKKYYEENGSLEIPASYVTKEGIKLGVWINRQKTDHKRGTLSKEKISLLEEIGIKWDKNSYDYSWEAMYELAKEYREQNKTLLIPGSFEVDGIKLGSWIITQRAAYKKGKLAIDRIRKLNEIGMIWEVRKNKEEITLICNTYNIDININKVVLKGISALELQAKIDFLTANNITLVYPNGNLIDIFTMSSPNMKEKYGLSLEEIINIYTKENKKVRIK